MVMSFSSVLLRCSSLCSISPPLQIIFDINFQFMEEMKKHFGNDFSRLARLSIIEEGAHKVRCTTDTRREQ